MELKASDLIVWGAIGIALYLVYQALSQGASVVSSAAGAAANAIANPIANLWSSLTLAPPMGVLGTVQFPNGNQVSTASLPMRTDSSGNVYVNTGGITYQLSPWVLDSNGNPVYPATPVGT